jgi:hypothetical protein
MLLIEIDIAISLYPKYKSCDNLKLYFYNSLKSYLKKLCSYFIRYKD